MSNLSNANPSYSFNLKTEGSNYHVSYNSAKLGIKFAFPLIWIAAILTLVLTIATMPNDSSAITGFIPKWIGYFLVCYVGTIILVNFVLRRGGNFSFNKDGFNLNSVHYASKDIQEIYVRSPKGEKLEMLSYTTYHGFGAIGAVNNTIGGINQVSGQARMAMMRAIREKSYSVCIHYGEREIKLAKNLTLLTAKAMLNKIDELI
jgi:hypothetical protein